MVEGKISGRLIEKRLDVLDRLLGDRTGNPQVGFVRELFRGLFTSDNAEQGSNERRPLLHK
jgi:hypothetical protein